MLLGLIAAVLCNRAFPGIRVFSTAYALPMAIASSSAAMVFQIMLHPTVGIVNKLTGLDINWLNDPNTALICVAILTAWLNSGINFLYFSAGLGNIDETIYERASVDGASSVQKFFSLTLPGLSPIMFYTLVVNIIQAFQSFGQIKILTEGGPDEATNVIVYSIYRDAFFNYRFGSAAAQSVILFIIVMLITLVMFRIEKNLVDIDYELYAEEGTHLKEMLYNLVDFDATAEKRRIQDKLLNNDMNLCLLEIMRDSLIALRDYPKNGQLYYRLLKYRYFEAGNTNEDVMLMLDDMPSTTYYRNRKKAIRLYATMLWAFTRPEKIQNKMEELNWKKSGSKSAVTW